MVGGWEGGGVCSVQAWGGGGGVFCWFARHGVVGGGCSVVLHATLEVGGGILLCCTPWGGGRGCFIVLHAMGRWWKFVVLHTMGSWEGMFCCVACHLLYLHILNSLPQTFMQGNLAGF